jgi:thioredoxin-like negative regulator of GroEL
LPILHSLAAEFHGRARVASVDADREGEVLAAFEASSFPTYLVFRDGAEVDRLRVNFIPWLLESRLRRMLERALD